MVSSTGENVHRLLVVAFNYIKNRNITALKKITNQALHFAPLRLRNPPDAKAQPDTIPPSPTRHHPDHPAPERVSANAVPSTALHLLTSTLPPEPQTNRSTAPANRSIRFTSLRFHCAQSVSAVQRKKTS
ncbi:MAG: hypothetical protein WBP54_09120 [Pelodictyon phaeoclathratiforme]